MKVLSVKNLSIFLVIFLCVHKINAQSDNDGLVEDDDGFDFDVEDDDPVQSVEAPADSQSPKLKPNEADSKSQEKDEYFDMFADEEEFENFEDVLPEKSKQSSESTPKPDPDKIKLQVAKVPYHFMTNWDAYHVEMLMILALIAYGINYFIGRTKNRNIAQNWFAAHKQVLEENFCLVGDDGGSDREKALKGYGNLITESDSIYTLWCSGRTCCEGMLTELKLIKRQDLVSLALGLLRPTTDSITFKIDLSDISDLFVFCAANRRTGSKLFKEMNDLSKYCTLVSKADERYNLPSNFTIYSELQEATSAMMDSRIVTAINKYSNVIDYIHISDQFSGPIPQEDPNNLKQPDVKKVLMISYNIDKKNHDMSTYVTLLVLTFYIMERLKRFRLSREGRTKVDKNRLKVEEAFLKSTHAARAEMAAQKREEKRKLEKERVFADDDPERQKRWELKEQKRQAKKKQPKMKQFSIKAL